METSTPTSGAAEAFALANSMAELGEINAAVDAYRQCLKLAPDCFPAHYNLGNAYIKTGRLVDAVESFVACLRIAPEFGAAYVNLAETLRALGLLEQAQGMAELGVQHLPGMVEAKTCLASILHDRSEFAMAETLYREALNIAERIKKQDSIEKANKKLEELLRLPKPPG